MAGMDVKFECKIIANPLINHYWVKNGRAIENSLDADGKQELHYQHHHHYVESKYEINIINNHNDFLTVSTLLVRVCEF